MYCRTLETNEINYNTCSRTFLSIFIPLYFMLSLFSSGFISYIPGMVCYIHVFHSRKRNWNFEPNARILRFITYKLSFTGKWYLSIVVLEQMIPLYCVLWCVCDCFFSLLFSFVPSVYVCVLSGSFRTKHISFRYYLRLVCLQSRI